MKTLIAAFVFAVIVTVVLFSSQKRTATEGYDGPAVGQTASNFQVGLNGATDLQSMKGKVVLLDFWATWCGPCRASMPDLERIYQSHKSQGFELIGISNEPSATVQEFLKTSNTTYPVLIDHDNKINMAYGIGGYPNEILIDKNGKIAYQSTGFSGQELQNAIDTALKG